ncbi:hypothetical protein AAIA72_16660 [Hahella sp. SMD15-11]|uniref:Uncharacterized protein n=1 Tax=Thermohahella caldifontis TaxID=3142973 RepID=A0AB39UWG5_9GAMM
MQPQQTPFEVNRSTVPEETSGPSLSESPAAPGHDAATTLVTTIERICEDASEREDCRQALDAIRDLDDEDAREALQQLDQQVEQGWARNRQVLESLQADIAEVLKRRDLAPAEKDQRIREIEARIEAMTGKGLTAPEAQLLKLRLEAEWQAE